MEFREIKSNKVMLLGIYQRKFKHNRKYSKELQVVLWRMRFKM